MARSPDHPAGADPVAGDVVIYPWICPYCVDGSWDDGTTCTHCVGRGLTDNVAAIDPGERQLAPRPPAVMPTPCSDCRYSAGASVGEPFWCHQNMPAGANGVMSPAAWAGGMPLGYNLCGRWWSDLTQTATGEENASAR